jgi:hypothetical protein
VWLYALIVALIAVAIAVQVYFLRTYFKQMNTTGKVIMYFNITLLVLLLLGIVWIAYSQVVR